MATSYIKDPDSILDYVFDWKGLTNGNGTSDWLQSAENITGATGVTVTIQGSESPISLALSTGSAGNGDGFNVISGATAVRVWLKDGTIGERYTVSCRIMTDQNRTDERSMRIQCASR